MNKERLLILATFLETMVPAEQWDYSKIVGDNWGGKEDLSCGTTGCAIGWAASIPVLRKAGMRLVSRAAAFGSHYYENGEGWRNAVRIFDLTDKEALHLFQPTTDLWNYSGLPRTATAAEVAKHIRAFVRRGGMPGEVVGYAVKMVGSPDPANPWRGSGCGVQNKPTVMTREQAESFAAMVPYSKINKRGRKVVKIVRRRKAAA